MSEGFLMVVSSLERQSGTNVADIPLNTAEFHINGKKITLTVTDEQAAWLSRKHYITEHEFLKLLKQPFV